MVKRRISVESIRCNPESTQALVVVLEQRQEGGETVEAPIGEKSIEFPSSLTQGEIIPRVKQAAQEIVNLAESARSLRAKINKELEKEELK